MKTKIKLLLFITLTTLTMLNSCKKEEEDTTEIDEANRLLEEIRKERDSLAVLVAVDSITNAINNTNNEKLVYYTVQVVSSSDLSSGKKDGINSATVYANQDGAIKKVVTDESGLAAFNLKEGNVSVTVMAANHTTLNFVVDLRGALSYASTIAGLFPTSGAGTGTISGIVFCQLDLSNAFTEVAPPSVGINAHIAPGQVLNYVSHSDPGKLIRAAYENSTFRTNVDNNGRYSLTVPASANGLQLVIVPDDFEANQLQLDTTIRRHIFSSGSFTNTVKSDQSLISDIFYQ